MKKRRFICYLLVVVLLLLTGCKRELRASEYVQANLHLIFQGETEGAKEFLDASDSDLKKMYENGIDAFVEGYLTGGVDDEGEYNGYFAYLVKEIFRTMRYQVGEAKKMDADTYEVEVQYHPVNVFNLFIEGVEALSAELEGRMDSGYYEGTKEEQEQLMLIDYLEMSYALLGEAYLQMEYGDTETFTFTVTRNGTNMPELDEKEINEFIECILALDKM